jgi:VIT1/CCC1 family predicted Fe2+/Mn2+ transporter
MGHHGGERRRPRGARRGRLFWGVLAMAITAVIGKLVGHAV